MKVILILILVLLFIFCACGPAGHGTPLSPMEIQEAALAYARANPTCEMVDCNDYGACWCLQWGEEGGNVQEP